MYYAQLLFVVYQVHFLPTEVKGTLQRPTRRRLESAEPVEVSPKRGENTNGEDKEAAVDFALRGRYLGQMSLSGFGSE